MELRPKKYHFIGIGGIGMSALAQVLHAGGSQVHGSELVPSKTTQLLRSRGISVILGHRPENVGEVDCVVWSSAIVSDHVEMRAAREANIPTINRAELLALLTQEVKSVAVAGIHGKTTVTGMLFHVLRSGGLDPTLITGGIDRHVQSNAHVGTGPVVLEADESDGRLVLFQPHSAILTNLEEEHMGHFKDLDQIHSDFAAFASHVQDPGCVAYCSDDMNLVRLARQIKTPLVSYGLQSEAHIMATDVCGDSWTSRFEVLEQGKRLGTIALGVPGVHNVTNALGAIAIARHWGLPFDAIREGLQAFRGTKRRLELIAEIEGVRVFDDYAHHPTEIRASLQALAADKKGRLIVVFQPHRYTRLRHSMDDFAQSFVLADEVIVTPVFSAGEASLTGVNSEVLAAKIRQAQPQAVSVWETFSELAYKLVGNLGDGDRVVGMGAGDIDCFPLLLKEALEIRMQQAGTPAVHKALSCSA